MKGRELEFETGLANRIEVTARAWAKELAKYSETSGEPSFKHLQAFYEEFVECLTKRTLEVGVFNDNNFCIWVAENMVFVGDGVETCSLVSCGRSKNTSVVVTKINCRRNRYSCNDDCKGNGKTLHERGLWFRCDSLFGWRVVHWFHE